MNDYLFGDADLPESKTIIVTFRDRGSRTLCCSGMTYTNGFNGLETAADSNGNIHLMLDWAGSSNEGQATINNQTIVASLTYNETSASLYRESCVDTTDGSVGSVSTSYMLGSRGADPSEPDRYFLGDIAEIAFFNRSLLPAELDAVTQYMELEWNITNSNPKCTPQYNCSLPSPFVEQLANLTSYIENLSLNQTTEQTYIFSHASIYIANLNAYSTRCNMIMNGTLAPLPNLGSDLAALESYLSSASELWNGMLFVLSQYQVSSDPLESLLYQLWL